MPSRDGGLPQQYPWMQEEEAACPENHTRVVARTDVEGDFRKADLFIGL